MLFVYYARLLQKMLSKTDLTLIVLSWNFSNLLKIAMIPKTIYFFSRTVQTTSGFILLDTDSESAFLKAELPHAIELIKTPTSIQERWVHWKHKWPCGSFSLWLSYFSTTFLSFASFQYSHPSQKWIKTISLQ